MPQPTRPVDVAVVGGGAIGLAVAWRAAQHGLRVTVFERGEPGGGTSSVAAGMLAPVSEATPVEQPLLGLGLASARAYPEFVAELADASGSDPGLLECGTLLVARDRDEAEALERELLMRQRLELAVRRVLPSEARRLEPALAPALRLALEIPDDHVIDPRQLTAALTQAVMRAGGELRAGVEVERVLVTGDRVHGLGLVGGESVPAEQVVLATGRVVGSAGRPADGRSSPGPPGQGADPPPTRPVRSGTASPACCGWRAATWYLAATAATFSAPPSRSAGSTRGSRREPCSSSCATRSSSYPGWTS